MAAVAAAAPTSVARGLVAPVIGLARRHPYVATATALYAANKTGIVGWAADKLGIELPGLPDFLPDSLENFPMEYLMGAGGGYVAGQMLFKNGIIGALIGLYAAYVYTRVKLGADLAQAANPFSGWQAPAAGVAATAAAAAVPRAPTAAEIMSNPDAYRARAGDTAQGPPTTNEQAADAALREEQLRQAQDRVLRTGEETLPGQTRRVGEGTVLRPPEQTPVTDQSTPAPAAAPTATPAPVETAAAAAPAAAPEEKRGWWRTAGSNIWKGVRAVTVDLPDTLVAAKDGIVSGWNKTTEVVSGAAGWVKDKAVAAGSAVGTFFKHPIDNTIHGLGVAWDSTKAFGRQWRDHPGQSFKLLGQGVLNATGSIVGMAGDIGMFVVNTATLPFRGITNGVSALGGGSFRWNKFQHDYMAALPKWTNDLTGLVAGIEAQQGTPLTGSQKVLLYGMQGIAETGAFIGVSVVTAGVGGAALATIRGGTLVARGVEAAKTARTVAAATETVSAAATTTAATTTAATTATTTLTAADTARRWSTNTYRTLRPWTDDATLAARFEQRASEAAAKAKQFEDAGDVARAAQLTAQAERASADAVRLRTSVEAHGNRIRIDGFNTGAEAAGASGSVYFGFKAYDALTNEGESAMADAFLGGVDPNTIPKIGDIGKESVVGTSFERSASPSSPVDDILNNMEEELATGTHGPSYKRPTLPRPAAEELNFDKV